MQGNLPASAARHAQFAASIGPASSGALKPLPTRSPRATPSGWSTRSPTPTSRNRSNDGLPESLAEVVTRYGHRHFKLKVGGQVDDDVARLSAIASVLDRIDGEIVVSLDGNEQYDSAEGVAELLARMQAQPALQRLWRAIAFIEQPIHRKSALADRRARHRRGQAGDRRRVRRRARCFVRGPSARLRRHLQQDLQGRLPIAS
jgi:L-alanine-DL-glutamate epimerase-like enolase superfamily enzyme